MRSFLPAWPRGRAVVPWPALAAIAAGSACATSGQQRGAPTAAARDSGAFVARLGSDTVAIERFVRTPTRVDAQVISRSPRTTRTRYALDLTPAGEFVRMEAQTTTWGEGGVATTTPEMVVRAGDSLRVERQVRGQRRTQMVAATADVLPFVDMAHWPYELALVRARTAGAGERVQPLLTGDRVQGFRIAPVGSDSMTITHPLRGTMRAAVDAGGRLLGVDAGATTRKLVVERHATLPPDALDQLAARWAALDAAGRGVGALSGRGQDTATVGGATVAVDYGRPAMRGRKVWGALVPWGAVWRTGANEATHLTTDRPLVLGAGADTLVVPAGRYTLFSIPRADGGHLIVNRQTGQGGTSYDAARDLGRVRLVARPLDAPVELFTIALDGDAAGSGLLRLQWERTELVVPLRVVR